MLGMERISKLTIACELKLRLISGGETTGGADYFLDWVRECM